MESHDLKLVRPLQSSTFAQSYLAKNSSGALFRLMRIARNTTPATTEAIEGVHRALLVTHENVLPLTLVQDDEQTLAVCTPYDHDMSLADPMSKSLDMLSVAWSIADATSKSHGFGIAHGCLQRSTIYLSSDNVRFACIDLLDQLLLGDEKRFRTGAMALAEDVASFGLVFRDMLLHSVSESASPSIRTLFAEILEPEWSNRPAMGEIAAKLAKCRQENLHCQSASTPSLMEEATQELPAMGALSIAKKWMVPSSMPTLGRYAIERSLGEGGMGAVFLGRDRSNDEIVALKVLSQHLIRDEKAARRFAKEARLLSTLRHPSIARLIEFNQADETMYLAMEFVPGGCLSDFTKTERPFDEFLAVSAVADAARGLAVAHQNGMVHRDIKPANLLLSIRGEASFQANHVVVETGEPLVKVADFGLAKHFDAAESMAMTQTGMVLGTPLYMAPEQCRGEDVGPPTDVYALGITLYQLLSGRLPYEGQSPIEIFRKQCDAPVPNVRSVVKTASEAVQQVIEKCLAKNALARYQDAGALLNDLEGMLLGKSTSIAFHPAVPDKNVLGVLRYQYQWRMRSSAESLWPYVSNTDRVNHAIGLPAVRYRTFHDPKLGMRRMAMVRAMGMNMEWEEHPYEWIEGRRLSVLRQFPSGPFYWFTNVVELNPQSDGETIIVQTLEMRPRNFMGKLFARFQIGNKSERNFGRVYEKIDDYLQSNATTDSKSNSFSPSKPMTSEQKRRLGERFDRVRSSSNAIDPRVLETLEQYLSYASDLDVSRIRPLAFAERFALSANEVVQTCLLAAREGALVLLWDILCPTCRIPSDVKETLKGLADHGHCEACHADYQLDFAQSVELIFRAHPEVRSAETRTYCVGGPAFSSHVVAQLRLQGDERLTLQLRMSDGQYRLRGPQLPYVVDFRVSPNGSKGRWDIDLDHPVAKHDIPILRSGDQVITLLNSQSDPRQVRIERLASRVDALTAADAARLPSFRDWFPDEVLSPGQMISLTNVTLLGCVISDAGKLYNTLNDQAACSLVLKHLLAIAGVVVQHSGCVIKSMNDGLHSVFPSIQNAVAAATQIVYESAAWNIKIQQAIHQGPAIVATINDRLDYFGETPQIMLTMLRHAGPSELWMTSICWSEASAVAALSQSWTTEMQSSQPELAKWNVVQCRALNASQILLTDEQ